jgi:signal transduction histidine kinase
MKSARDIDLVRPLARRTAVAAFIAAFLLTLATPLSLYWQTRRTRNAHARSYANRMAELVRDVVVTQPTLWRYDAPKLANHLELLVEGPGVEHVVLIDSDGRRIDVPIRQEGEALLLRWASAPVFRGHEEIARVWVAIDASAGFIQVLIVLLFAVGLGATLSTVLYVVPVRVVSRAEKRIVSLLEKLETAQTTLAELNAELEERVEQRSRQLAETAEALRRSEARLRDVAGRAVEATEQERQRVARELHDGVGQLMTGTRLSLQVLSTTMKPDGPERDRLNELEQLVDESMDELRRIAMDLHPAALDRLGLEQALAELCSGVATRASLDVSFESDPLPEQLPAAVESASYRLIQECLTNVVRYAEATSVTVQVTLEDERQLHIRVVDDGRGFETSVPSKGLGLRGMNDRAALLSGNLVIESDPKKGGTSIEATFPIGRATKELET